jgi:hypothetical protein
MKRRYKKIERDGWIREFVADSQLAKDAEEIYNLLDFEVLRLPMTALVKEEHLLFL